MTPALVLLHGFTHTGASWDPVVSVLGERYLALAPDIRGHGSASAAQPITLEAVIGDVGGLAPAAFTLAGYSMGGRLALHVALANPERVDRLVLIGASPGIENAHERADRAAADERLAQQIEYSTIDEFARVWAAATPVLAGQPAGLKEAVHADRLRNTPAGLATALRALGPGALPSLWERLAELKMPVSLIVGERDQKFTAIAAQMAEQIADVEVVIVPGAGHAVHLEAPERVGAVIAGD